jgi:non-ribosomal peptide synthetase component E (peptide arylation enzyme)
VDFVDVILFQAENSPEALALVGFGSVIPYGRLAQGILSAQNRLTAIGLKEGDTVGLNIAHPIDHLVMICALYRMRIATASIQASPEFYLDNVPFAAVMSDAANVLIGIKQPSARSVIVNASWFQDHVAATLTDRTHIAATQAKNWICRISHEGGSSGGLLRMTAGSLEAQLQGYCLASPPDWERMISIIGLHTSAGLFQALTALWLGRLICFSDVENVRQVAASYKHHYLVAQVADLEKLLALQEQYLIQMPSLRAAFVEGAHFKEGSLKSALATISCNLICAYAEPDVGIVAFGPASRMLQTSGAVGFLAPWADAEVCDAAGAKLPREQDGALRVRAHTEDDAPGNWIPTGRQGCLLRSNMVIVRGR